MEGELGCGERSEQSIHGQRCTNDGESRDRDGEGWDIPETHRGAVRQAEETVSLCSP